MYARRGLELAGLCAAPRPAPLNLATLPACVEELCRLGCSVPEHRRNRAHRRPLPDRCAPQPVSGSTLAHAPHHLALPPPTPEPLVAARPWSPHSVQASSGTSTWAVRRAGDFHQWRVRRDAGEMAILNACTPDDEMPYKQPFCCRHAAPP